MHKRYKQTLLWFSKSFHRTIIPKSNNKLILKTYQMYVITWKSIVLTVHTKFKKKKKNSWKKFNHRAPTITFMTTVGRTHYSNSNPMNHSFIRSYLFLQSINNIYFFLMALWKWPTAHTRNQLINNIFWEPYMQMRQKLFKWSILVVSGW